MKYRAVVFDLDGTLLDTLADLAQALNTVLAAAGHPTHGLEEYKTFVGSGARTLVARALPTFKRDDKSVQSTLDAFLAEYARNWKDKSTLYPGIAALLDALVDRSVRLAILTNKPQHFAELCVQEFLHVWPFEVILGQREGLPVKPDAAVSAEMVQALGLTPQEILYVGDSDVDMLTGVNGGFLPVGVLWGFRSAEELHQSGAAKILAQPLELLELLP